MSIKIYKDDQANAIFMEDANGVQFLNSLQATVDDDLCSVTDLAKGWDLVTGVPYTEFVDHNDASYGNTSIEVCDALNAMFRSTGTSGTELPVITSNLTANLVQGETLNYELTADFGVGYEWDLSGVTGLTTVDGNPRKLIGGSSLTAGTYNIPVKAINYNGEDSETVVLTVSTPPFANTKSVKFSNQDYCGANAAQVEPILGRTSNGSGDAWTIAFWYKGSADNQGQTIVYFGSQDVTNNGFIELRQTNHNGLKRLRLRYGSNNNYIQLTTPSGSITPNTWHHIVLTFNGGQTGSSSSNMNSYYNTLAIYIDEVKQTTSNSHNNYGYTGSIVGQNFRLGRFASGSHMKQANIDELAIWDSDQSSNVSDIYNSGVPFDLLTLTDAPPHWWPVDGSIYPYLQDNGTEANCTFQMYNMTAADIVNDVP